MAAFTVIDHTELGSSATSWSVSSIPSSYDHLLIKCSVRTDVTGTPALDNMALNVGNSGIDTGTNYSSTWLYYYDGTPRSTRRSGDAGCFYIKVGDATGTTNTFTSGSIWLPNYSDTSNYKQFIMDMALEGNSIANYYYSILMRADLWSSTSAITDIRLLAQNGNFVQYSTFTLYGVTGA